MKPKWVKVVILSCLAFPVMVVTVAGGLFFYLRRANTPPKEAQLIQNFNEHRAAFEQLKEMLITDGQVRRVADWGVETTNGVGEPPVNFPTDRYNQYLVLLKQAGALQAYRNEGGHPDPGILVWAAGFGGDTAHVAISWEDQAPTNQVASLDEHHKKRRHGEPWSLVYRHLDGNWYIWSDR